MAITIKREAQANRTLLALREPRWLQGATSNVTELYAERITDEVKRIAPRASGAGIRGIGVVPDRASITGHNIEAPLHMVVVDQGRKPGGRIPPRRELQNWMRRVGIPTNRWYVIARSIARDGTRPRHFFRKGIRTATRTKRNKLVRDAGRLVQLAFERAAQ